MSKPYILTINKTDPNRWNCVYFVRARVPELPFGMWTLQNKKKICNTTRATVGSVAIIATRFIWGHLAIVKKIGYRHFTIEEANYRRGKITERHGTSADLMIIGFFNPNN